MRTPEQQAHYEREVMACLGRLFTLARSTKGPMIPSQFAATVAFLQHLARGGQRMPGSMTIGKDRCIELHPPKGEPGGVPFRIGTDGALQAREVPPAPPVEVGEPELSGAEKLAALKGESLAECIEALQRKNVEGALGGHLRLVDGGGTDGGSA